MKNAVDGALDKKRPTLQPSYSPIGKKEKGPFFLLGHTIKADIVGYYF